MGDNLAADVDFGLSHPGQGEQMRALLGQRRPLRARRVAQHHVQADAAAVDLEVLMALALTRSLPVLGSRQDFRCSVTCSNDGGAAAAKQGFDQIHAGGSIGCGGSTCYNRAFTAFYKIRNPMGAQKRQILVTSALPYANGAIHLWPYGRAYPD